MSENELRELDAWIAEHVMGWRWVTSLNGIRNYENTRWLCESIKVPFVAAKMSERMLEFRHYINPIPSFTTDPAAAMEVLKMCAVKLNEDCKDVRIEFCEGLESFFGGNWAVCSVFRECEKSDKKSRVFGKTAEIAICLFAKKLYS